jgi:ATP-dependent RNA helicase DeaD
LTVKIEQKALTVPTVEQVYYEVDRRFKIELLTRLIDIHDYKLGIIFCNTKRMVDDLVDHLNAQGYSADRLHGDMTQGMRDRVMNKFRNSALEFLVATDVAARGIDVDDVQVVVNYDLPYDPEDYVHRIGRTGRAGRSGRAISFVAGRELFQIQTIERFTKQRIQRAKIPTLDEVEQARATVFLDKLRATLVAGEFQKQDHLIEVLLEEGFTSTDIASALIHQLQSGDGAVTQSPQARDRDFERPVLEHDRREIPRRDDRRPRREPRERDYGERRERQRFERRDERAPRETHPPRTSLPGPKVVPSTLPVPEQPQSKISRQAPAPAQPNRSKESRRTPHGKTRLYMNIGSEMGIAPRDVVGAIMGETGLAPDVVGTIDIRDRHLFADVASEHANSIVAKLNRTRIKEHRVKVKVA